MEIIISGRVVSATWLMAALCESDAECYGDLSSLLSSETGTEATEHESTSSCVSLLDRLRSPKPWLINKKSITVKNIS